ncbi:virion assembly protein [Cotia virus SPAn232]|uniref:Assembly protein G7 n=2 Tax=Cotia virus TaxID=39444 RepID=H6TA49_9POXV|nr:virion assembly protein [Cotia virus SPAn232]ADT91089.1 virion assembly protein [Cotia virus SPAn232]AIT70688.1 virion assembly protein [Cotia virus]
MIDQKQSVIYPIISKSIIRNVVSGLGIDVDYLDAKAKQLCYCKNQAYKENVINSIYTKCEHEINIKDIKHLLSVLDKLKYNSIYVCNSGEFNRLYNSLYRFTHSESFFNTCTPTIITTLSTLITLILSNKLLYAAEMVEIIENYLFNTQKTLSYELSDLLEMKYGLINLVQYKIFPMLIGENTKVFNTNLFTAGSSNDDRYSTEINKLMDMPIKSDIINNMYTFLYNKGVNTSNNIAEYVAGLKIEEIIENEIKNNENLKILQNSNIKNTAMKLLNDAEKVSKGHVLDGSVKSPITKHDINLMDKIPFNASDIEKFTILEYLYIMRVMATNIKKKNCDKKASGIVLNINSPFKISIPDYNNHSKH